MTTSKKISSAIPETATFRNAGSHQPPRRRWGLWVSWTVLIVSLAVTLAAWNESRTFYTNLLHSEFRAVINQTRNKLDDRIVAYTQVLRSSAALFAAAGPAISREQWRLFIKNQELDRNYPAIPAVAFARSVSHSELDRFIEEMQHSGVADFVIRPPGKREHYVVNSYAEPFIGGNIKALGYDMWQDNDRRITMERAAESGQPMITERTTLRIDEKTNPVPAFIMYLPVRTENAVYGYLLCPFRMPTLMQDLLGQNSDLITLDIFDGTEPIADKLFYQSDNGSDMDKPRLTERQIFEIGGRNWTLQFTTRTGLETRSDSNRPRLVLAIGLIFSLLLFIMIWSLSRTRARAEALALNMTQSLSESQNMLQGIVDNSPTLIYKKDIQGRYLFVNKAWHKLFHSKNEDVLGKTDLQLFPEKIANMYMENDRRILESGTPLDFEETALLDDGIHYYRSTKFAVRDHEGSIYGLCGLSADSTDRRKSEEKLQQTNEMFSLFMRHSPVYVYIKEVNPTESRVLQASENYQEMIGIKGSEMIGKTMTELFPEPFAAKISADDLDVVSKGEVLKIDEDLNGRNYTTIKFPIVLGAKTLLAGYTIDITDSTRAEMERQNMEKQLLHAQKLESLGVLAGGIAHDFNNILTAIIGNADLALMRINKESPATENLHRIEQAASRAADLAKQMLAYSGKGKFIVENINLNTLLEEMLHMLEISISKKALLRLNLHQPLPLVEADATQMRQIIMNLVINASEAIGDKSGVIAITSGCMECDRSYLKDVWLDENISAGIYVFIEIADSGCGMDKDTLSKLFDPFFTTKFTGRGLGMAAVLGILRGHKGAIKIYSEPSRGSTFKILLPASGKPVELFSHKSQTDSWQGSGTVLLVDDEDTVRAIGSEMLKELGFTPVTANDGQEALKIFKSRDDINFVILDLTMPRMDGEQCFRELQQLQPNVKVMMSSGYSEQEVSMKFVGKGMAGFIQKPYKLSELKEAIKKMLQAQ
ncbi:MAG: CHASE domain-containing protein [Proteobacteria bacterium]|nr:CHASE domain-containing protein [Pseudomonadota bacterium]